MGMSVAAAAFNAPATVAAWHDKPSYGMVAMEDRVLLRVRHVFRLRPGQIGSNVGGKLVRGGYSGYFADPDGFVWEIAWNPSWHLKPDGSIEVRP